MNAIIALILRLILILLAYVFVGWVAYWIFYDFRNIIRAQKTPEILPIKLQVEIGSEKSEKLFTKNEITIGRDPSCDFSLQDEAISQRHCKLSYLQKHWWAEDMASTNGTYLNDTLIDSPIILTDGDQLQLGHIKISIQLHNLPGVTNE
jgi:pSer/pThr/pTyr-binding forkhead associated (FHA) protein